MDIGKLRGEDIGEFERRWPDAAAFLKHRELVNERTMLRDELNSYSLSRGIKDGWKPALQRHTWITARLKELEFLGDAT